MSLSPGHSLLYPALLRGYFCDVDTEDDDYKRTAMPRSIDGSGAGCPDVYARFAQMQGPLTTCFDMGQNLYIPDFYNSVLLKVTREGTEIANEYVEVPDW